MPRMLTNMLLAIWPKSTRCLCETPHPAPSHQVKMGNNCPSGINRQEFKVNLITQYSCWSSKIFQYLQAVQKMAGNKPLHMFPSYDSCENWWHFCFLKTELTNQNYVQNMYSLLLFFPKSSFKKQINCFTNQTVYYCYINMRYIWTDKYASYAFKPKPFSPYICITDSSCFEFGNVHYQF